MLVQLIVFILIGIALIAFADEIGSFLKNIKIPLLNKPFVKHTIALLALTVIVVLFSDLLMGIVRILEFFYSKLLNFSSNIFGKGGFANSISIIFSLLTVACVPWLLLSAIYWLINQKRFFPYCRQAIWVTWFILVAVVML